jgi:acyl-CoA reductase-like NAD-dependent aldehyde dehydrogenase
LLLDLPVARQVHTRGVANNKRVQAFGGGENHMVVLPDADLISAFRSTDDRAPIGEVDALRSV